MKIETFKKRFDFPIVGLDYIQYLLIQGKNGSYYNIRVDNGEPIATKLNEGVKNISGFITFNQPPIK